MTKKKPQFLPKSLPRLQDFLFIIIFSTVLLMGNKMLNLDGDLPRHLVTGKYILQNGGLPENEPFVYPYQDRQFVSQQWLAGVIFFTIHQLAGLSGIVIFSALILAGVFTLLYRDLTNRIDLRLTILLLVIWGAAVTSLSWATRPHLFSMFFLTIWLIWVEKLRRSENIPHWYFPVLMLIWTNMHGEFIAGILVLLAYCTGAIIDYVFDNSEANRTALKNLWFVFLLCVITTIVNPGGLERWTGILGFMNNQYMMSRMLETNPPNFQMPEMRVLLGLMTFSIILLAFKKNRLSGGPSFLLAGFSAMSLIAFRNIHLYGIVAPFVLSETLITAREIPFINRIEDGIRKIEANFTLGFTLPIAMTVILTMYIYTSSMGSRSYLFNPEFFPVKAVEWLKLNPQDGNMFNDLNWGGYISLNLWPEHSTFVDSVSDITGELTMQYEKVITLQPGWDNILEQNDVEWVIIPPQNVLANELIKSGWVTLYHDETTVILHDPQSN